MREKSENAPLLAQGVVRGTLPAYVILSAFVAAADRGLSERDPNRNTGSIETGGTRRCV